MRVIPLCIFPRTIDIRLPCKCTLGVHTIDLGVFVSPQREKSDLSETTTQR